MNTPRNDSGSISIFIPDTSTPAPMPEDPAVDNQALRDFVPGFKRVVKVGASEVEAQWNSTIATLMNLSGTIGAASKGWEIDEMEVGLTLSAKGELLFIAEAGAEASIKIVLKKK